MKNKQDLYNNIYKVIVSLTENETDITANLANISSALNMYLEDINWVGFYIKQSDELVVNCFQGNPACTRIKIGNGVCGTSAYSKKSLVVGKVHEFKGHIACDSASNSEIVVPILLHNEVIAILDIDSPLYNRFDEQDRIGLEKICCYIKNIF